jgi:histidine triad (HIT) family protein
MSDECVICQLVTSEIEVSMLHQDELCSAFMDIQPVTPGHLLVVPNRHAVFLADITEDEGAQIFRIGQRMAAALRKCGVKCEGVNFFVADGVAAGQEVFHVHLHVIPRFPGDGFGLKLPPDYKDRPPRSELNDIAGKLRDLLEVRA